MILARTSSRYQAFGKQLNKQNEDYYYYYYGNGGLMHVILNREPLEEGIVLSTWGRMWQLMDDVKGM